jgi:hypothetical protein
MVTDWVRWHTLPVAAQALPNPFLNAQAGLGSWS